MIGHIGRSVGAAAGGALLDGAGAPAAVGGDGALDRQHEHAGRQAAARRLLAPQRCTFIFHFIYSHIVNISITNFKTNLYCIDILYKHIIDI